MTINTELIPFHGDQLVYVEHEGLPFTAIKPICERLGVSRQGQRQKLSARPEVWGGKIILLPSASGEQETFCIPISRVAGWLFMLHASRVREELREALRLYQIEAADVLDRHFRQRLDREAGEIDVLRAKLARSHGHLLAANPRWAKIKLLHDADLWWSTVARMLKMSDTVFGDTLAEMQRCGILPTGDWQAGSSTGWFEQIQELTSQNYRLKLRLAKMKLEEDDRTPLEKVADGDADAEGKADA